MRSAPLLALLALLGSSPALGDDTEGRPANPEPVAAPAFATPQADVKKPAAPKAAAKPVAEPAAASAAVPLPTASPVPKAATKTDAKVETKVEAKVETKTATPAPTPDVKADAAKIAAIKSALAKPDTKPDATPDAFAGTPHGERLKIQAALLWSGDYTGAANGEDPMLAAIKNFQKRSKAKVTGVLTVEQRATLVAAAQAHEQEFGWSVVVDPATGIRIGLPSKMVPQAREAERGTRWSSAHGEVQVETFRIKDAALKLSELFERQKKEPGNRKVEYSVLRDDGFFISGLQGLKKFSVRAKIRDGEVRGFTMLYDQMMETIVAPVMVAMASAFSPFPERSAPFAALAKSVEYGNGLVVSARGHIVSDRRLTEGCQVIVASGLGSADRIAVDADNGLALLRVYGPRQMQPLALPQGAPKASELTLVGIPDPKEHNGSRKLTEIKARLVDGMAIELRQPVPMAGFTGAAALDAQGRVLGMTEMRNFVLASTEPAAPPVRLVSAEKIRNFLGAHDVPLATAPGGDAKASVVRIICVRK